MDINETPCIPPVYDHAYNTYDVRRSFRRQRDGFGSLRGRVALERRRQVRRHAGLTRM